MHEESGQGSDLTALDTLLSKKMAKPLAKGLAKTLGPILAINKFERKRHELLKSAQPEEFLEKALKALTKSVKTREGELARIPREGAVVVVANHPYGGIEGLLLTVLLRAVRPDVKFLANSFLNALPEFQDYLISVNPFGGKEAVKQNTKGVKEALRWLKGGGMLVIFPAGEVSHLQLKPLRVSDPQWDVGAARLARKTGAAVLPILIQGANGPLFQLAGLVHPRLRTALLPREMLNKGDKEIPLRIGAPIPATRLARYANDDEATRYLRLRTYLLDADERGVAEPKYLGALKKGRKANVAHEPIIAAVDPEILLHEVNALPEENTLIRNGAQRVVFADAAQIPMLLQEIGRLREVTFRQVGEGTGLSIDLDRFDADYVHLFVWNDDKREVVGAYRMGRLDELIAVRGGKRRLYTSTLFKFKKRFLKSLGPALEMGRSFVRPEYQRSYAPLMLLWKGIGRYVAAHPQYRYLFGPVSITTEYAPMSRELIVNYLQWNSTLGQPRSLIKARKPFRLKGVKGIVDPAAISVLGDLDDLSGVVTAIEQDGKGIPVLLRQYLKLGGKLAGFNIDPAFSNVLDGLIFVDLLETEPKTLIKYMGAQEAEKFRAYHQRNAYAPVVSAEGSLEHGVDSSREVMH
ncbi:lysophospholipid acyltransferase family protein [Magnetofaba australis]|uniref:L-ornithine N(alpha)-acyltransferase n=1 Tax=Magnetofaba australis IT-1 TaxID=1434232 RepID=A0A1Y2K5H3_9PROT|nr:lysophospholipid acyltransferase family protein [Magnetofaba australis]OSM04879.1 putative phospholipid/glycerol acyltransferase [Magnetofaba australis IT-1]